MKLLLAAFGVAVLAVVGWIVGRAIQESREWRQIVAVTERGLGSIPSDEQWRVAALLQKRYPREEPWGLPWAGLHFQGPGAAERIVLFHGGGSMWPPAVSMIPISVLDGDRRDRSVTWILPGDESKIVRLQRSAVVPWCFELETSTMQEEKELRERQVYALLAEKPVLIRLEDDGGRLRVNDYRSVYLRIGEDIPERSAEEWERALGSADLTEVLRTLLWLGGLHDLPTGGEASSTEEPEQSRQAVQELLRRDAVRSLLLALRVHRHPWVAEAAAQIEIAD